MNITDYTIKEEGELEGKLLLIISHNTETYELEFEFKRYGTPPHAHSPFPSSETEIYAWPIENIPNELQFEAGTKEAAKLAFGTGLPDEINLLPKPYSEVQSGNRSPFILYSN
jgi:hypothetical protein